MASRTNEHGQPIGDPVAGWSPRRRPEAGPFDGRYCRVVPLRPDHAEELFATCSAPGTEPLWTYLAGLDGPFPDPAAFADGLAGDGRRPDVGECRGDHPEDRAVGIANYLRIDPANGSVEVGGILLRHRAAADAGGDRGDVPDGRGTSSTTSATGATSGSATPSTRPSRAAAARLGFPYEGTLPQRRGLQGPQPGHRVVLDHRRGVAGPAAGVRAWLDPANFDEAGRQRTSLSSLTAQARSRLTMLQMVGPLFHILGRVAHLLDEGARLRRPLCHAFPHSCTHATRQLTQAPPADSSASPLVCPPGRGVFCWAHTARQGTNRGRPTMSGTAEQTRGHTGDRGAEPDQALEAPGAENVFGIPGGAILPGLRPALRLRRSSATSWCATSRAPATPPRATPPRPARSASAWPPAAPARPTWSPRSPTPTWTPSRSWRSPARSPAARSAPTPSRRPTSAASRCRSPSTTSWSPTPRTSRAPSPRRSTSPPPAAPARCWSTSPRTRCRRRPRSPGRPSSNLPGYRPVTRPHAKQVREAARLILEARRPVLYVGGGVIRARRRRRSCGCSPS